MALLPGLQPPRVCLAAQSRAGVAAMAHDEAAKVEAFLRRFLLPPAAAAHLPARAQSPPAPDS